MTTEYRYHIWNTIFPESVIAGTTITVRQFWQANPEGNLRVSTPEGALEILFFSISKTGLRNCAAGRSLKCSVPDLSVYEKLKKTNTGFIAFDGLRIFVNCNSNKGRLDRESFNRSIKMVKRLAYLEKKPIYFNWVGKSQAFFNPTALEPFFPANDPFPVKLIINSLVTSYAVAVTPGDISLTNRHYDSNLLQQVTEESLKGADPGFEGFTEEAVERSSKKSTELQEKVIAFEQNLSEESPSTQESSDSADFVTPENPESEAQSTSRGCQTVDDIVMEEAIAKAEMLAARVGPNTTIPIYRCIHPKFLRRSIRGQMDGCSEIRKIWKEKGNGNKLLAEKFEMEISEKDVRSLAPGQWLNSRVIDFALQLLSHAREDVLLLPAKFYELLQDRNHNQGQIRTFVEQFDNTKHRQVIVPVCHSHHWSVIYIDVQNRRVELHDGLHDGNDSQSLELVVKVVKEMCPEGSFQSSTVQGPRLDNGLDGGLFIIYTVRWKLQNEKRPLINDLTSEVLRAKIGNAIVNTKVDLL